MIKIDFEYNPYLMEYDIRFNGVKPRINSLIEKYQIKPLQEWVRYVPQIFCDEMNGYGFEIVFSGTCMDFKLITDVFCNQLEEGTVICTLKHVLEERITKVNRIRTLIQWLEDNENHRFDLDSFKIDWPEVYDNHYPALIVGTEDIGDILVPGIDVSEEIVKDISELEGAELDLQDKPVVFSCNGLPLSQISEYVNIIYDKNKADSNQLFFYSKKKDELKKTLVDLGLENPVVIDNEDDDRLENYFYFYPVSTYIRNDIYIFDNVLTGLNDELSVDIKKTEETSGKLLKEISELNAAIELIKKGISDFEEFGTYLGIDEKDLGKNAKEDFFKKIGSWRSRKIKTNNSDEAKNYAEELDAFVQHSYDAFKKSLDDELFIKKEEISNVCMIMYKNSVPSDFFNIKDKIDEERKDDLIDSLTEDFLALKTESAVKKNNNILDTIFGNASDKESEMIVIETHEYQKWRELAYERSLPVINKCILNRKKIVDDYKRLLSCKYLARLKEVLEEKINQKVTLSEQLSEDNKILQEDKDWVSEFESQVEYIKGK